MIEKKLKDYIWSFEEDTKRLGIYDKKSTMGVGIDRLRIFSLMRFLIRVCQKLSQPSRKRKEKNRI